MKSRQNGLGKASSAPKWELRVFTLYLTSSGPWCSPEHPPPTKYSLVSVPLGQLGSHSP